MMFLRLLPLCLLLATPAWGQELEVHFLDVGQGDSTLVIGPTGITFLFDAGDNGDGNATVIPYLQQRGITNLDIVSASHYHADHVGGLDEVWNAGIHASVAYDRGDYNHTGTQSFYDYRSKYSGVRQTVAPGQVVDLGGGAFMTCVVVQGMVMNGQTINIGSSSQWENSASIAWKVEYGDFDLWLGGDLTGGGNGTVDVETQAAYACGDVDVYQANHHGSRTSTNYSLVQSLQPEFTVIPCGHANSYGYPTQEIIDRVNKATRATPVWSTTDGVGTHGYVDAGGHIVVTTDGTKYTATSAAGSTFTALCDEIAGTAPQAGDLVVGEFMRQPSRVNDADGEWLELTATREAGAISLADVGCSDQSGANWTMPTGILLEAGETFLTASDGLLARNGGTRPALIWPQSSLTLGNSSGSVKVKHGSTVLEEASWTAAFPGGNGISAERINLLGDVSANNFADAVSTYGLGDWGTPGATNDADSTPWPGADPWIDLVVYPSVGGPLEMDWYAPGEAGYLYQGWLALGTVPGVTINGTLLPANIDRAFRVTHQLPGWSGTVPTASVMDADMQVPNNPALRGLSIFAFFTTYSNYAGQGIQIRSYSTPLLMFVW